MSYQKVPLVATLVSVILAIIKFIVWLISGSVAILSSAMDSLLDVWISVFNWFALKTASAPPDSKFNYGKWKIEGIAAVIEGTIIFLSGLFIIYESLKKIWFKETIKDIDLWLIVMIISIVVVGWLVMYLNYMYNKTKNLVIKSDVLHYKTDLITNLGVILSLIIVKFTWIYRIDFIMWFIIWIYIAKEAIHLIREWIWILLDEALEERNQIAKILDEFVVKWIIKSWHDLKTRKWWRYKFVEYHFVVDPNTTVKEAHDIWDMIAEQIKKLDPNSEWEVIYHPDREDDSKCKECKN